METDAYNRHTTTNHTVGNVKKVFNEFSDNMCCGIKRFDLFYIQKQVILH